MTAADNKKLMQTIFAGVAAGDRTLFVDSLADDVTMTVTGQYSWSQTFHGKESVLRDLYGYVASLVKQRRSVPFRIIADDEWVAVNTIIEERTVRDLIPKLKAARAEGIVEYPLNKIVL